MAIKIPKGFDPTASTRQFMDANASNTKAKQVTQSSIQAQDQVVQPKPQASPARLPGVPVAQAQTQTPQGQFTVDDVGKRLRARNPDAFKDFTDAQIGERAVQKKPELAALVRPPEPQGDTRNLAQQVLQPVTDMLATGYRTATSVPGLVKGLGQYLVGDQQGGAQSILEAGKDVEKPVNIPFLGEGQIRKLGTVDEQGFIKPSEETVKSLGTAAELAAMAAPTTKFVGPSAKSIQALGKAAQAGNTILPRTLIRGAEGALIGGLSESGRAMRETGDLSNVPGAALTGAVTGGIVGGAMGAAGRAVERGVQALPQNFGSPALASRAINSVIKPLSKQFEFGKNPGATVAKFKIVGNNFEQLAENVSKMKSRVGEEIRAVLRSPQNEAKIMDITGSLKPIDEAIQKAAETGDQTVFRKLQDLRERITNVFGTEDGQLKAMQARNLNAVTPEQATDIKRLVGDMVRWTEQRTEDDIVNGALYKVYGNIKNQVQDAVPGIKQLNEDYGGLLQAEKAVLYRDKIAQRLNLVSLPGTVAGVGGAIMSLIATGGSAAPAILFGASGVAIDKALKSPAVMTRIGAWLSRTPQAEKQRVLMQFPELRKAIIRAFGIQAVGEYETQTAP